MLLAIAAASVVGIGVFAGRGEEINDRYLTKEVRADYPGFEGQERALAPSLARRIETYMTGDERQRIDAYRKWGEERAASELKTEMEWDRIGVTPCSAFGSGTRPQLCIEHLGPLTVAINTPVVYRVRWRNMPDGAYIRVWSRNGAAAGNRWKYSGAFGAIAPDVLRGSRNGDRRVSWDGRSVFCAPADGPMMCDAGEVGRYVLRAAIMTGSDPFWPSFPPQNPVPVVRFAQSETEPFTLDGPPQPITISGRYRTYPQQSQIVDAIRKALPAGGSADWYVERRIQRLGPWRLGLLNYCASLPLDKPLVGSVDVCFSRFRRDANGIAIAPGDIFARSSANLAQGVMSSKEAVM